MNLSPRSKLAGLAVNDIEQKYDVSVVLLRRDNHQDMHPSADRRLAANDVVAVLGGPEQITRLAADSR
jgi:K+/H+ antiporter YhaU regulatory subunit KhtT